MLRISYVVLGCLVASLIPVNRDAPAATALVTASNPDAVRVEHRFVVVELAPVPAARNVVRAAQKPARVTRPHTARRTLFAQARQLVLGDGRLRPEPFPRPAK